PKTQETRKDSAVHVSLSSLQPVKQHEIRRPQGPKSRGAEAPKRQHPKIHKPTRPKPDPLKPPPPESRTDNPSAGLSTVCHNTKVVRSVGGAGTAFRRGPSSLGGL
ncbi:hypothetical protein, partial [Azorhizobium sp. AG788]|uniref:hypothetical protein n=1 Tax=Azorhizobium sp. AG788 TaxID=2183897 RepID=UPI003138D673